MAKLIDPTEETGKQRVQRIPIDYYKKRSRLDGARWWIAVFCLAAAGAYASLAVWSPRQAAHFSTGPLASPHASFEQDCHRCHQAWTPIAGDAWQWEGPHGIERTASACRDCHAVASHHADALNHQARQIDARCAGCHHEHQGREHSLIQQKDRDCTRCHGRLDTFRNQLAGQKTSPMVEQFTLASHGDFRSLQATAQAPTGRIKFNHDLHMQPGQVAAGRRGSLRLERLDADDRHTYRQPGQDDQALVQLSCAACHSFSDRASELVGIGSSDRSHSRPIRYEDHCAACHPLTTVGQDRDRPALPHGPAPARMKELLRDRVVGLRVDAARRANSEDASKNRVWIPGKTIDTETSSLAGGDLASIDARVAGLVDRVRDQCRLCHLEEDIDGASTSPMIPGGWLRSGQFDHAAHLDMNCLLCHPQADPQRASLPDSAATTLDRWLGQLQEPPQPSEVGIPDHEQIMILGIASCLPCHHEPAWQPAAEFLDMQALHGNVSTRAPDRCTTCHDYHQNSAPQVGPELQALNDPRGH